ncbi:hypothetical protein AA102526_1810 [Asaia lannensis NBRC 102526]|nr:hypothetical protein AA102526_1810 [Asaia lannensis NBRC 102526]
MEASPAEAQAVRPASTSKESREPKGLMEAIPYDVEEQKTKRRFSKQAPVRQAESDR